MRASPVEGVGLVPAADLDAAVDVLRLLADPTRLAILRLLAEGEDSVGSLADRLQRHGPAVSQHLSKLRAGHLVTTRREGSTIYYSVANEHVVALVSHVIQQAEHVVNPARPAHHS